MSEIAKRLAGLFEYNEASGRTVFTVLTGDDYEALTAFVHQLAVDEDTAYDETLAALEMIAEEGVEIEDDFYCYCEPDIYPHKLLEWVSKSPHNMEWCDEVIEQKYGEDSFVSILMSDQSLAKQHVWMAVIDLVQEMEEESD